MKYQLKTYGGDTILLTDNQYQAIVSSYDNGATEFPIGSQRIPRSSIAYIGYADGATEQIRQERTAHYQTLSYEEQKALKAQELKLASIAASKKKQAMIEAGREDRVRTWKSITGKQIAVDMPEREVLPARGMSNEEEASGDKMYYLNEYGEKMYS